MKRVFVDTSYMLALVNDDDENHDKAIKLAQKYRKHHQLTTQAIILEIGNSLSRSKRDVATRVIKELFTSDNSTVLSLSDHSFEAGFGMYETYQDKTWGLVDCISFVVMREEKIKQALTFDQHFAQAGFQIAQ